MDKQEIARLQAYLCAKFENAKIRVEPRPRKKDSAEVYIGEEYLGIISRDDEDGEVSWNFDMAILEIDLEG